VLTHRPSGHPFEVVLPPGAHLQGGVVDDDPFARRDVVVERLLGARPPALLRSTAPGFEAAEVVQDHEVVWLERLWARPAELLGDADVEQPGRAQQVAEHR
jgi:hypothetical protein